MRQKRVGPLQSSEFSPLVFIPLCFQHKKMEEKRINIIKYVSRYIIACLIEKPNFFTIMQLKLDVGMRLAWRLVMTFDFSIEKRVK